MGIPEIHRVMDGLRLRLGALREKSGPIGPFRHALPRLGHQQRRDAANHVIDVTEAPCLRPAAEDRERLALDRLDNKIRDHASVIRSHAWSIRIKNTDDARIQPVIAMVGHRHRLAEAFGFIIDAARTDRVDIAPIRFRLRVDQRVAIHFRRAGQQKAGILGFRQAQRFVRPQRTDLQGRDRKFKIVLRTGRRSEMEHRIKRPIHVDGPLDAVLHFASPASPQDYLEFPIATLKVGALGTHKALGLAKAKDARFLLASTSEVYGDPLVNPQPESYWGNVNPISPRGVYDEAKRFGEAMTMAYHRYHGLDTRIVRIFNTYGPRMRPNDGRVVSNFIVQAIQGKPLTVFGGGTQTRSFCYVDDMVRGIAALLTAESGKSVAERTDRAGFLSQRSEPQPESIHDPVNLGNPHELTVMEIARLVLTLTGSNSPIQHQPLPVDDPRVRRPDIRRAKALLGWEPKIELEDGLRKTIEYFLQVLKQG